MTVAQQVQALITLAEQGDALVAQLRPLLAQIQAAEEEIYRTLINDALAADSHQSTRDVSHLAGGRRLANYLRTLINRPVISGDLSAADLATKAYASITGHDYGSHFRTDHAYDLLAR